MKDFESLQHSYGYTKHLMEAFIGVNDALTAEQIEASGVKIVEQNDERTAISVEGFSGGVAIRQVLSISSGTERRVFHLTSEGSDSRYNEREFITGESPDEKMHVILHSIFAQRYLQATLPE